MYFFDFKNTEHRKILLEYKNEPFTHTLYRFLVKSNLIESIEEIELELSNDFDPDVLFELVSNYKFIKANLISDRFCKVRSSWIRLRFVSAINLNNKVAISRMVSYQTWFYSLFIVIFN